MLMDALLRRSRFALTAAAFTALLATTTPSWTQTPAQLPGVYRLSLGDFQITSLSDGTVPQDLHKLLTGTTSAEVDALLERSFLKNPVEASINAFLINTGSRLAIVDTGAGGFF